MAWMDGICPECGEMVEGDGILVAEIKTTTQDAYGSCKPRGLIRKTAVRVLFSNRRKSRRVYHRTCWDAREKGGKCDDS